MKDIVIRPYEAYCGEEIRPLYESVGWISYLRKDDLLEQAYARSLKILAAWQQDELVGVIRAVGDGCSILFIQDLIVHPSHQRKGIGTALMQAMLQAFPDVNQTVLMTDDTENTVAFYEKAGFMNVKKAGCLSFVRLNAYYG